MNRKRPDARVDAVDWDALTRYIEGITALMKKQVSFAFVAVLAVGLAGWPVSIAEGHYFPFPYRIEAPAVFQAAGPSAASILATVDQFKAAIGGSNNGNAAGPITGGRREINWDGGGSSATAPGVTPFDVFLISRGARVTTPGTGFVQAPPAGLAATFANPSYEPAFAPFSLPRLFSPVGSNVSRLKFFLPGGGELPASTSAFGAVFSDVDQQNGLGFTASYDKTARNYLAFVHVACILDLLR